MRLLSLTVRNYRVHRELTVNFDPSRNLIGGPNESGKSTLAEATHRALFLRAKTGGNLHKEMVSTIHHGDPEVVLLFEACGTRWELEKRFAGARGSTRLTAVGEATLRDDEADAKLSEILGTESGGRANANQLAAAWAHLWVWQGSSGQDPADHATAHKDTLVQRLQNDGIAAVMQSASDQRVRERISAAYDELFTGGGRPKAGSKPEVARTQLTEAESALEKARETAARLEQAVNDHASAEREIADADKVLPDLKEQRSTTEAKLSQVAALRGEEETRLRALETAAASRTQLEKEDRKIRELYEQATVAREALLPAEATLARLVAAEEEARAASQALVAGQREADEAVRQCRLRLDLAAATLAAFEKTDAHQRLAVRVSEADSIRDELATVRASLAKVPPLSAQELAALRRLERETSQAGATLEAMAAGIELIRADTSVTLDDQPLAVGESRILTEEGELAIGDGTRLRIRPGGGSSLSEARVRAAAARRAWSEALDRHTLRDLDHAAAVFEQRQAFEQQVSQLEARWKTLGGEALVGELAAATAALDVARAEVLRRIEVLDDESGFPTPANFEEARAWVSTSRERLSQAETTEASASRESGRARAKSEATIDALRQHRDRLAGSHQSLRDLEISIKVLEETHGDTAARQSALASARETESSAVAQLALTRQALAALVPESLTADLDRFSRAIAQQENRRREAENRRLVARDRLTLDGSSDPGADLSHALARCDAAREVYASEYRRAKAVEKLHGLFSSARETIDRALVQPLADHISGYLQCLFGPGAAVRVNLSDSGIEGLDLIRPGDSSFHFSTLSGGAREQVAAAVRLAMAEILAADHDGCLPIVFDDAFAYTDSDRVQALQRMLDLAAGRGLQVIVLTCSPADYAAFGAAEIRIA